MNRKQFFNKCAEEWDSLLTKEQLARINKLVKLFGIGKGEKVLDLGCGTGVLSVPLNRCVGNSGEVIGVDFSDKMIEKAKKKYGDRFKYICCNAEKMPFKSQIFDTVVCFNTFPHFVHKNRVIQEISRVLKKYGKLIISHTSTREEVNSFHSTLKNSPVIKDFLPEDRFLIRLLSKNKFSDIKVSNQSYYLVSAVKKGL